MKTRSQPFDCAIAGKTVGVSLRHGGGLQEPAGVYVRCDERDCQYVDLNQAPCPLRIDMFADTSDHSVAFHIAENAGRRFCYACLTEILSVTHEQVRRASWRLKDLRGFAIKPARCVECHRRRVTIGVTAEARAELQSRLGQAPVADSAPAIAPTGDSVLATHLKGQAGFFFCAHCLARKLGGSAATLRDAMWSLEPVKGFLVRTAQCVSCLLTKRVIRFEADADEIAAPRRIIEWLIASPGADYCTSCLAFATDVDLAEARRITGYLEPLTDFRRETAACSVCGRLQPVISASPHAGADAEGTGLLGDVLSGHLRHRGYRIDLLSFRTGDGWRPFALVKSVDGALVPNVPALLFGLVRTKVEADQLAAAHARDWIDKHIP